MHRSIVIAALFIGVVAGDALAQGDPDVIARVVKEGTENSQAWDRMVYLSEEIGPRLTGSSALLRANAWTRDEFAKLGLDNCRLAKWGEVPVGFDRGPSTARMVEPQEREFEFTAQSWSAGTDGPVRGRVLKAPQTLEELESVRDDLVGAWVLSKQPTRRRRRGNESDADAEARAAREAVNDALREANIAGRIYASRNDLVVTSSARGWREMDYEDLPTDVAVTIRRIDYDAINSRLADGETVEVEIDLQHHFVEGPIAVYNTIAEIPGTERPEEVVIVSGHLDSWDGPGCLGAQDNALGCAVALESARLLMAAGAKPKRTIRFILWTGEEQGLLGSRGYLEGLDDEERAGISAVFVEDGGTGYEGALLCIEPMVPMLELATAPVNAAFPDMPVELVVNDRMPRGGGSDHSPFNRAGIPGFFWQEYGQGGTGDATYTFIHHTQHDIVRYAVPEQVVQSAVCMAVTAYNLSMADTLLVRQEPSAEEPRREIAQRETPAPSAAQEGKPGTDAPAPPGPLTGQWKAKLVGAEAPPDSEFTITFEMSDDGSTRGKIKSEYVDGPLGDIVYDAASGKLAFTRDSEMMGHIKFQATVAGDVMKGTLNVEEEFVMPFEAKRVAPGDIAAK